MVTKDAITQEMIDDWKKEHGEVYRKIIGGKAYVYRPLRRSEYKDVMTAEYEDDSMKIFERQDDIVRTVVLYPENIDEIIENYGGVASTLADIILEKSGFGEGEDEQL